MVAASLSATINTKQLDGGGGGRGGGGRLLNQHASRPLLLSSDPVNVITPRNHKCTSTSSSSSNSSSVSSKRCPSPSVSRTTTTTAKHKSKPRMNLKTVNANVDRALQHSITHNNRAITAVSLIESKPASVTETVFSGTTTTTSGAPQSCFRDRQVKRVPQAITVSARSWQETTNRARQSCPKKNTTHSKRSRSPLSSPKAVLNSRGRLSPSILSLVGDVNKIEDAHLLRLHQNRLLQWRFVNARANATLSSKTSTAEKSLYNAWTTTSKLQESVRAKRIELQLVRQNLKLNYILKEQMVILDEWAILDHHYCSNLCGATKALMASTLRLPIVCGTRADVPKLKDAICSAVDVMQAITSSISSLLSKVAKVNSLAAELGKLSTKELVLLYECKQLLSAVAAMRVKECSLSTNILQLNCLPSTFDNKMLKLI